MKLATAALLVAPVAAFNMDMTFSVGKKKAPAPKKAAPAPKKAAPAPKKAVAKAAPKVCLQIVVGNVTVGFGSPWTRYS